MAQKVDRSDLCALFFPLNKKRNLYPTSGWFSAVAHTLTYMFVRVIAMTAGFW